MNTVFTTKLIYTSDVYHIDIVKFPNPQENAQLCQIGPGCRKRWLDKHLIGELNAEKFNWINRIYSK